MSLKRIRQNSNEKVIGGFFSNFQKVISEFLRS
jgi:hypothetical protein